MDNTPAAMAQNNPDSGTDKELSTAGSGGPAVPVGDSPEERLIKIPYVRGVDFWRDLWRNILAIILTALLMHIVLIGVPLLLLPFFNVTQHTSAVITGISHLSVLGGYPSIAVALLAVLIVVCRHRQQQRFKLNKTINPGKKLLGALLKLFAALTSLLFLISAQSWADLITERGFPPEVAVLVGFLLICIVVVSTAAIDAHLAAVDPLARLEEEASKTIDTIRGLEDRFGFLPNNELQLDQNSDHETGTAQTTPETSAAASTDRYQQHTTYSAWNAYRLVFWQVILILMLIVTAIYIVTNTITGENYTAIITGAVIILLLISSLAYVLMVGFRIVNILAIPASGYMRALLFTAAMILSVSVTQTVLISIMLLYDLHVANLPFSLENPVVNLSALGLATLFMLFGASWKLSLLARLGRSQTAVNRLYRALSPTFKTVVGIHNHYRYRLDKIDNKITMLRNGGEVAKKV